MYHADEEPGLLRGTAHTSVTDNADGEACRETGKTDRETGAKLNEALEEGHLHRDCDVILSMHAGR